MHTRELRHLLGISAKQLLQKLDDAVMPLRCVFCGTRTLPTEGSICDGCRDDLPWLENACPRCAEPLPGCQPADVHCPACQSCPSPVSATVAPLLYEFPVDAALKALKFKRRLYYAPAFGDLLCAVLDRLPADIDALLPVPLHWRRQMWRGFNQAAELCRPVREQAGLPLLGGVVRARATRSQSGLAARERSVNLRHAFAVHKQLSARHVLVVDDVITTGETTRHLAQALLRSGVKKVSVLAVARAT